MQVASSVLVIFLNMQLRRYAPTDDTTGDDAIAAFSNINRLLMLVGMIIIGMTQGMQPIVGYNYGAKNYKRVKATLVYTIKMASIIACTGFVLSQLFPRFFVQAFTADPQLIRISAEAMRYATLGLLLVGAQMVISNFFQSIGKATKSIFLSLTRQFIFYLPCLYLLPHFWGLKGVWLSMSTSDILAAFVAFAVIGHQIRAFNRDMAKQTL
jgi:Na+-driven multidrug efflux pump